MRIVFLGSGAFAIPSFEALLDAGHEIVALVTQPDREKGRGPGLAPPPLKPWRRRAASGCSSRGGSGSLSPGRSAAPWRRNFRWWSPTARSCRQRHRHRSARHGQRARLAAASLPRRGAHPVGDRGRRDRDRRDDHDDRRGPRHRPHPAGRALAHRAGRDGRGARAPSRPSRRRGAGGDRGRPGGRDPRGAAPGPRAGEAGADPPKEDGRIDWTRSAAEIASRGRGFNRGRVPSRPRGPAAQGAAGSGDGWAGARREGPGAIGGGDGRLVACGGGTRLRMAGCRPRADARCPRRRGRWARTWSPARASSDAMASPARRVALHTLREAKGRRAAPSATPSRRGGRVALDRATAPSSTSWCRGSCGAGGAGLRPGAPRRARSTASTRPCPEVLRLGAYQILYLRVAEHAAVSEAVELARAASRAGGGLTNAVLRRLQREGAPAEPDPAADPRDGSSPRGRCPPGWPSAGSKAWGPSPPWRGRERSLEAPPVRSA